MPLFHLGLGAHLAVPQGRLPTLSSLVPTITPHSPLSQGPALPWPCPLSDEPSPQEAAPALHPTVTCPCMHHGTSRRGLINNRPPTAPPSLLTRPLLHHGLLAPPLVPAGQTLPLTTSSSPTYRSPCVPLLVLSCLSAHLRPSCHSFFPFFPAPSPLSCIGKPPSCPLYRCVFCMFNTSGSSGQLSFSEKHKTCSYFQESVSSVVSSLPRSPRSLL